MNTDRRLDQLHFMGLRLVAIAEALLIIAAILLIDQFAGAGDRFMHVQPHPFWIPVLLVAAQYGALEGVVAAICAGLALLVGNIPALGFGEDPYGYIVKLLVNPAMWVSAGFIIGELRGQADRQTRAMAQRMAEARQREQTLLAAAERLATANRALEERVAGQLRTVASLYEASRAVEQLGAGDVLVGIAGLVRAGLNPGKFSLFLLNHDQLEAVLNEGWSDNDRFTRVFDANAALYREVIVNRRFLSVTSRADQAVLGGEGLLAGPILSAETGETLGMLKVERMGALDFNMTSVESFRVLCQWIGTSFARARTFEHAASRSFVGAGGILSASAAAPLTEFLKVLARRARFEVSAITIAARLPENFPAERRADVIRALREPLSNGRRLTDIVCESGSQGLDYLVLAPVCPHKEALRLAETIRTAIMQSLPAGIPVRLTVNAILLAGAQPAEARA